MRTQATVEMATLARLAPLITFAVLLPVYGMGLSNHLTEDSIWYANDILHPTVLFFHPHHLLYDPVMRVLILPALALSSGPEANILFLQWVNVLLGAAAISVFCAAAIRFGATAFNACTTSLLLGLSAFSYSYSSQIEVYSLTCLFLSVALIGLARPDDTLRSRLITATGFACALFFHQTAIFFALALLVHELLANDLRDRDPQVRRAAMERMLQKLAVTILLPLVFVALVYMCIGLYLGHRTPIDFVHWLTLHVQWGHWGAGTLSESTLVTAWNRFWQAVLAPGSGQKTLSRALVTALAVYIISRVMAAGRAAFRHPPLLAACLVWMSALAIFTGWWDARGAEFWGMFLMPVCLVLSLLGPASVAPRLEAGTSWPRRAAAGTAWLAMATMLLVLILTNVTLYRRDQSPNDLRESARALLRVVRDGDIVLSAGTDGSTYYRTYLEGRRVEVSAINVGPAMESSARCQPESFTSCLVDVVEDHARAVAAQGGRFLIDQRVLNGRIKASRLTEHLGTEEFSALLKQRFEAIPLPDGSDPAGAAVYELRPRRPATDATKPASNSPSR